MVAPGPTHAQIRAISGQELSAVIRQTFTGTANRAAMEAAVAALGRNTLDVADWIVDDGATDNAAAINAAILASPEGGTVDFRNVTNAIRIATPINLIERRTYLFGLAGRMWPYRYTPPIAGSVKTTAGFTGAAAVLIQSADITGRSLAADGIRVEGLVVDCGASSGNVHGVQVEGLCRDLSFENCAVQDALGTSNGWDFRTGTGTDPPRGVRMSHCAAYSCAGNGFRFNAVTDSRFFDLLATGNSLRGFYLSNSGENDLTNCAAVFNGVDGFFLDGTVSVGMTTLTACSTDRNAQSGILISQSGTQPIQIIAPRLRRDGSGSTSNNYAGVRLSGSAGLEVVPVDVVAPQVTVGVDDGGGGSETPQYAIRALRAQRLTIHGGDLWGVSAGLSNGGNNTIIEWSQSTYWAAGAVGAKAREFPTAVGESFRDIVEQSDPSAPPANTGRLYVRDNGGGKTQLVVRFPTGAIQVIATEP